MSSRFMPDDTQRPRRRKVGVRERTAPPPGLLCWFVVQPGEAREQRIHIFGRGPAIREQDAVADRRDQNVDRFVDRESGLAMRQSAALEGLQMAGRVSATARGGFFKPAPDGGLLLFELFLSS